MKLHIKESLEQLEPDMFVTDYVGDVVNLMVNKPKPYRFIWERPTDIYVIGDGEQYIHRDLIVSAKNSGHINSYNNSITGMFIPYEQMVSDWLVEERNDRTYIKTGIILTNGDFPKLFPDLYNKLKNTRNFVSVDDLVNTYKKSIDELQNKEKQLLSIFNKSDIEMQKDYKGYGSFKDYLKLRQYKMNRIRDDLPALCLSDIFVLPDTSGDIIRFWTYYDQNINGHNLYDLKNELYDNLCQQGSIYENLISFLDDMKVSYKSVFNYI